MKGIWFTARGKTEFVEEEKPACQTDTVLLQTLYSGLSNGTERNKLMGGNYNRDGWPDRIGYQHVSRVIETGSEITRFAVGDIVFTAMFPGHVPFHRCKESDLIVKLPEDFDLQAANLMGVASVSMHDARLAEIGVGDRVLVFGAGLIGLFAAQASLAMGAEVTVVDRNADRLELASALGVDHVLDNTDEEAWEPLAELGPFSVCLECSGADIMDRLVGTTWGEGVMARAGRLVFVAGRFDSSFNFNAASGHGLVTYSTAHFVQDDLDQVLRLARKGVIKLRELVRDVVPITDAVRIYDTLRDEKRKLLGTIFDWTGDHGLG